MGVGIMQNYLSVSRCLMLYLVICLPVCEPAWLHVYLPATCLSGPTYLLILSYRGPMNNTIHEYGEHGGISFVGMFNTSAMAGWFCFVDGDYQQR